MNSAECVHDLTIYVRVRVTDPAAVLANECACDARVGPDGELSIYLPGTIEEAVVAIFTCWLDRMFESTSGLQVIDHSEQLAGWDRERR